MDKFPIEKLKVKTAKLSGADGNVSLEIRLEPFDLEMDGYTETFQSAIRLDGIGIPSDPQV